MWPIYIYEVEFNLHYFVIGTLYFTIDKEYLLAHHFSFYDVHRLVDFVEEQGLVVQFKESSLLGISLN